MNNYILTQLERVTQLAASRHRSSFSEIAYLNMHLPYKQHHPRLLFHHKHINNILIIDFIQKVTKRTQMKLNLNK